MSVGTELPPDQDNSDNFLGRKDNRIETYIIEKATERTKEARHDAPNAVVFGLSGNPPTINHLVYINHLMTEYKTVYTIINAQSPLKDPKSYLHAETRLKMLQKMLEAERVDPERCKIERLEIDRAPPSRMIATISLLILHSDLNTRFTLALGLDGLVDFSKWYKWQQYGDLCDIKFYPRQGVTIDADEITTTLTAMLNNNINVTLVYNSAEQKHAYETIQISLSDRRLSLSEEIIPTFDGSATELREYYGPNHPDNTQIHRNIHPVVDAFIREQELYGYVSPDKHAGRF